eukprot:84206-Pyramimonas_sp.AAC.2
MGSRYVQDAANMLRAMDQEGPAAIPQGTMAQVRGAFVYRGRWLWLGRLLVLVLAGGIQLGVEVDSRETEADPSTDLPVMRSTVRFRRLV